MAILTPKQRAVVRLLRAGLTTSQIAQQTGLHRVTICQLTARAKKNLARAGLPVTRILTDNEHDVLDLVA